MTSPSRSAVLALLLLTGVAATVPVATARPASRPSAPRVVAERHAYGGFCRKGPCETIMSVRSDGVVVFNVAIGGKGTTRLSARQASRLVQLVELTNVDPKSLPKSTDCPPAYDGEGTRYVLHRKAGTRIYDQCEVALPTGRLFTELDRLWKIALSS